MNSHEYTPTEFAVFAASQEEANYKAKVHGYNIDGNSGVAVFFDGTNYTLQLDEADSKSTISTNLAAASAPANLTVVTATQTVTADGVDTKTFDLDGEPNKVVDLFFQGELKIDKITLTLDGTGNGSFVVGTYASGFCTDSNGIQINCEYADKIAAGVVCTVKVVP